MITKQQVSANLRAFYLSRLDWIALSIVAVIDIWTKNGLDLADILLLQAIFGFAIMILEYPSGILADLTSRKVILIFAASINIVALMVFFVANSYLHFVIAEIFFAVSLASRSGADVAHIYDTYLEAGNSDRANEVLATGKSMTYASIMTMTAIGGILTSIDWRIPFIIGSGGYLITGISYMRSFEPDRIRMDTSSEAMKASISYLKDLSIIKLGLILLFVNIFLRISFWDYLPRLELLGVDTFWYGLVLAGANGIALMTSLMVRRYKKLVDQDLVILALGVLGLVLFLNTNSLIIVLIAILLHQIYRGAGNLIYEIKLNQKVLSSVRASINSLISAILQGLYFLLIVMMNILDLSSNFIHLLNAALGLTIFLVIIGISLRIAGNSRDKIASMMENKQETTVAAISKEN